MVGDDGDALLGIAPVVDENAGQHAAGLALANANGEIAFELGETAGLQDVGDMSAVISASHCLIRRMPSGAR